MQATYTQDEIREAKRKAAKPMMWIGLVGIIMLFAGLTSAYIVRQAEGNWLYFDIPDMFYTSTVVILISSFTLIGSVYAIRNGNRALSNVGLLATLIAGIVFCVTQFLAWGDLVDAGIFFAGRESNAAGSFLYVLSGLHVVHVAGGIIAMLVTTIRGFMGLYSAENHTGIEVAAIYWHFLDILWIYLLLFLLFIR